MQSLKEEVKREGLATSVIFLGRRNRDELSYYYSAADCFWLLSNYDECLPLVYLEAQACGIPAIGRKKGGRKKRSGIVELVFLLSLMRSALRFF